MSTKRKKKRKKAVAGDREEAPANTRACLESDRGLEWCDSIDEEIQGLIDMGVVEHGYTLEQIKQMGITTKPIPLVLCHGYKHSNEGEVNRLKSRACLQGHSGNMFKGAHYWDTFTATPREDTSRVMQAMLVRGQLKRKAADIKQACCWAKLPKHRWLVGIPPKGLRKANEEGEELYMLVKANLYGSPEGGRNWGLLRDYALLSTFNNQA